MIVAAKIGCDPRLAEKIIEHGPAAARNRVHRERAPGVLKELGIAPPAEEGAAPALIATTREPIA